MFIILCIGGLIVATEAVLRPGGIPNSTYIASKDTWVCPIIKEEGVTGSLKKASLKVTHCPVASDDGFRCPGYMNPVDFVLTKGEEAVIIKEGNKSYYQTSQLAQFFGNKVCISYPYYAYTTSKKEITAQCRSKCFKTTHGPIIANRLVSSLGSYAGNGYRYDVTSSSTTIKPLWLFTLLFTMLGFSSMP